MVDVRESFDTIAQQLTTYPPQQGQHTVVLLNKTDQANISQIKTLQKQLAQQFGYRVLAISAKQHENLSELTQVLYNCVEADTALRSGQIIVSNARHHEALEAALTATQRAQESSTMICQVTYLHKTFVKYYTTWEPSPEKSPRKTF